jgi:hypothetical protein
MALVRLWHIKEELCKGFSDFSKKKSQELKHLERRSYYQTISQTSTT